MPEATALNVAGRKWRKVINKQQLLFSAGIVSRNLFCNQKPRITLRDIRYLFKRIMLTFHWVALETVYTN